MEDEDAEHAGRPPLVGYDGRCAVCGWVGYFHNEGDILQPARRFRCDGCDAPLRFRDEAHVIVEEFGAGVCGDLDELVGSGRVDHVAILHVGFTGPVRDRLCRLPGYHESTIDTASVDRAEPGVRRSHEDLQDLSFEDATFDLVISNHVMEHVPDPWRAFAEINRVLRPAGVAVTSIPVPGVLLDETRARASIIDGVIKHHTEVRHHTSPEGEPALVFSDFGADVVERTRSLGLVTTMRRPHLQQQLARRNVVLVSRRLDR